MKFVREFEEFSGNRFELLLNFWKKLHFLPCLGYGDKDCIHGPNRIAVSLPPTGPYYAVFECKEFIKTVLFVVMQSIEKDPVAGK